MLSHEVWGLYIMSTDYFDGFSRLFADDETRLEVIDAINSFFKEFGICLTNIKKNSSCIRDLIHCLEAIETIADPNHIDKELFYKNMPLLVHEASKYMHTAPKELNEAFSKAKSMIPAIDVKKIERLKLVVSNLMFKLRKLIPKLEAHTPPTTWYRNKKGYSITERAAIAASKSLSNSVKIPASPPANSAMSPTITPIMNERQLALQQITQEQILQLPKYSEPSCRCVIS